MHNLETLDKKYLLHEAAGSQHLREGDLVKYCIINAINPWQMKCLFTQKPFQGIAIYRNMGT